jgi:hypothetical protein
MASLGIVITEDVAHELLNDLTDESQLGIMRYIAVSRHPRGVDWLLWLLQSGRAPRPELLEEAIETARQDAAR